MPKNILIPGGAGYIGSHTAKLFLQKGFNVTILDNLTTGYAGAIEALKKYGSVKFLQGDLKNKSDLKVAFDSEKFDAVIHFAALLSVNDSMLNPASYFDNNVCGTLNLLEEMLKHQVSHIVFSSTCATYGESQYLPVDENHPQIPTNPYGESKLMVEKILNWFSKLYGMHYVALRYFNVCGASEDGELGDSKSPSVHLVQNVVRGALGIEPFQLTCATVDTPDKTPIRDYVDVLDLAEAHFLAYEYLVKTHKSDVFNLGNGTGYSVLEIVNQVEKIVGVDIPKIQGDAREGEYASIYADISKAREILGWEPKISLQQSVNNLVNWYKNHPKGFEK